MESELQNGAINYPDQFYYEVGSYHDNDETFPMIGWLSELTLWRDALSAEEVAARYQAGASLHPAMTRTPAGERTPAQAHWAFDGSLSKESAHFNGGALVHEESAPACARFDGTSGRALLNPGAESLPTDAITIESFVYVEESQGAGCIASAFDQHGGHDAGWVLGWQDGRFRFGLSSEDNPGAITWVTSSVSMEHHRWYHVVGTYDGKEQALIVDGKDAAVARGELGVIRNPVTPLAAAAWWQDDAGEHFSPVRIQELLLYDRAMDTAEAAEHFAAKAPLFPSALELTSGPSVRYLSPTEARVSWSTKTPSLSFIEATAAGRAMATARSEEVRTDHALTLTGLGLEVPYHFLIKDKVRAVNRSGGATRWFGSLEGANTLALAGTTLFVGGKNRVIALDSSNGNELWTAVVTGEVHSLAVANGKLFASTSSGWLSGFLLRRGLLHAGWLHLLSRGL